jgi:hypothetical protein
MVKMLNVKDVFKTCSVSRLSVQKYWYSRHEKYEHFSNKNKLELHRGGKNDYFQGCFLKLASCQCR